ncbi:MAG: hydroxyethylthiazole kinase [Lentisphaerae bacterium]|nr:hydroxyethylthiazole kinase [Lentisphaerota bacterium]
MKADIHAIDSTCALLAKLRREAPLVHCMTNAVVTGYTANALLALGAAPAMIHDPEETAQFAAIAGALLVNIGTLTQDQAAAMRAAVAAANQAGRPWVLDPVAVGFLSFRTTVAAELKRKGPAIIRGNASEIIALAGFKATARGVDSTAAVSEARETAELLVEQTGAAVLVTGEVDVAVAPGREAVSIANGHAMMTRVTGVGCAQGAIAAAFAAVAESPFDAAVAAALVMGVAGEMAYETAKRPGAYQIALLDALDAVDEAALRARGKTFA